MFAFKHEPDLSLLTVVRSGFWSLSTVMAYELALRSELAALQNAGGPTCFIIDIRSSGAQALDVANELRAMVRRLGPLHANRTAVVTSSGIAKLQARRVADDNSQVFTSMVLARDWVLDTPHSTRATGPVHDNPSEADAEGATVHMHGPSDVDLVFTPRAAIETAKRISNAAVEALLAHPVQSPSTA
jgi:hypothetical protein